MIFKGWLTNMVEENQNGLKKVAQCLKAKKRYMNTIGMSITVLDDLRRN
ncbi:MAG: hypothetical protein WCR46_15755 [Deltaproteobacteria bacterium]